MSVLLLLQNACKSSMTILLSFNSLSLPSKQFSFAEYSNHHSHHHIPRTHGILRIINPRLFNPCINKPILNPSLSVFTDFPLFRQTWDSEVLGLARRIND